MESTLSCNPRTPRGHSMSVTSHKRLLLVNFKCVNDPIILASKTFQIKFLYARKHWDFTRLSPCDTVSSALKLLSPYILFPKYISSNICYFWHEEGHIGGFIQNIILAQYKKKKKKTEASADEILSHGCSNRHPQPGKQPLITVIN